MSHFIPRGFGWHRDLPDARDYTISHDEVRQLMLDLDTGRDNPDHVDWRDYCVGVDDQQNCNSSTANACVSLLQYFERRATGRIIDPSRLFVYKTARRLLNWSGDTGAKLRTTWKAVVRFGAATERVWPFEPRKLDVEPDAFAYSFDKQFASMRYVRLDQAGTDGEETLRTIKAFLAAGFASVFGFPVYSSVCDTAELAFPTTQDNLLGGQAVMAIGFDNHRRIRSDKGALLVRNSWGDSWGENGYGWLPYHYVRARQANDFWTLLQPAWLNSGEFALRRNRALHHQE